MRILRAVDRAHECLPLRTVLRFLRVSPSRFHAWRWRQRACALDDQSSCPRRLTANYTSIMRSSNRRRASTDRRSDHRSRRRPVVGAAAGHVHAGRQGIPFQAERFPPLRPREADPIKLQ
jgi:hypothetical protein